MPLSGSAFWACLLPVEKTNLVTNPSFERGTQGWGTLQAGTIGTTSAFQQFGAWSGSVAPTSNGTAGAIGPTFTAANGSAYTFSAYVRGQNGIPYRLAIGDSSGVNFVGSTTFTGGGTWHRYVGSYTEGAGATRRMVLTKNSDADTGAIYIDGAQVELGSLTTYLDGDQEGCYWLGQPHLYTSLRSGTSRAGGSVVALADLGLKPNETPGAGVPPMETLSQSFALDPGAEFLNQRASERPFTLTCTPLSGTTQQDYHRVRRNLIMALKPDTVEPQSPARLWYTGGLGTVQIDAVLDSGFGVGDRESPMTENVAIRFIAHDPYWYATTQQGTSLTGRVGIGSANNLVARDALGRWGTLGANGSTVDGEVRALAYSNGTVIIGGAFGSTAGTRSGALSFYSEASLAFGTFGGTVENSTGIRAVTVDADGTIYFGGGFSNISGLSNTRFVARYSGGFATITGGTTNNQVYDFAWQGGTLAIGGQFTGVSGTTTGGLALWTRSGYGSTSNGTINAQIFGVAVGLNRTIYVAFQATGANVAGTSANHIAQYFGSWGTMGVGMDTTGAGNNTVTVGPNGVVYAGGEFQNAGGGTAVNVAQWNGVQWFAMGSGIGGDTAGVIVVNKMVADQNTGDVYAVTQAAANSGPLNFPDNMARWNGYRWLPLDVDLPGAGIDTILLTPARTMYIGGAFTGTAQVAGVAQIVNSGMADVYPIFKARNSSAGTITLYQLVNTLTGAGLYFDLRLEIGEEVTLVTEPGNRSFTSSFRGNIFSSIIPGSNLADFALKAGTNYLSFFADSGSVAASVFWTPRGDSFDMGTNY